MHKAVAINCFYNQGSTIAENIGCFMYKYNIVIDDWHRPLSYLVRKVYKYDDHFVNIDKKRIAIDVIDLCRRRDSSFHCAISFSFRINDILKILCKDKLNIVMHCSKYKLICCHCCYMLYFCRYTSSMNKDCYYYQ